MTDAAQLTASGLTISVATSTDIGLKRKHNEDAVLALPAVYVVADGMGGYEAGDEASAAVVDAFREVATGREALTLGEVTRALELADAGVAAIASRTTRGAGSTVAGAALVILEDVPHWLVFNVGDSRVYRHAAEVLEQITVDHSLGQELFASGRITAHELDVFKGRNVITRAIGASDAAADSWSMPVRNGERLLLCSDGLTSEVDDETIRAVLSREDEPAATAAELVEAANRAGGKDNITVIVIDVLAGGRDFDAAASTGLRGISTIAEELDETTAPLGIVG